MPRKSVSEILTPTALGAVSPPYPNPRLDMSSWLHLTEVVEWVGTSTSVDELNEFIRRTAHYPQSTAHVAALAKRQQLQFEAATQPHWTVIRSYRLLIVSVALAAIALIVACVSLVLQWRAEIRDQHKGPDSPPVESTSPSSLPTPRPDVSPTP